MVTIAGVSLVVQWLELHASTEGVLSAIPDQGTEIPKAARHRQLKKQN